MRSARCPKCEAEMERGFVVDRSHANSAGVPTWASGAPERNFFGVLRMRGRTLYRVQAQRCRRCGFLESYATEPAKR